MVDTDKVEPEKRFGWEQATKHPATVLLAGFTASLLQQHWLKFEDDNMLIALTSIASLVWALLLWWFVPLLKALRRKALAGLSLFMLALLGGCATADCETIYARARAWRAVAVAAGAGSAATGVGSLPASSETETGLVIGSAALAAGTVAAGYLADSYADEYRGYCGTASVSVPRSR